MTLSLTAETLLLTIDPGQGGLLAQGKELRTALGAASEVDGRRRRDSATMRTARRELSEAGLIEQPRLMRRLRLADRMQGERRFDAVKRGATSGAFDSDRDRQLLVVLAACGVLAQRLDRDERRAARHQLAALIHDPDDSTRTLMVSLTRQAPFRAPGFSAFDDAPGPDIPRHPNRPDPNSVAGALTWDSDPQGGGKFRDDS